MIRTIKNFVRWLIDYETSPVFGALFFVGTLVVAVILLIVLLLWNPLAMFCVTLAVLLGVPVAAYIRHRANERGDDE